MRAAAWARLFYKAFSCSNEETQLVGGDYLAFRKTRRGQFGTTENKFRSRLKVISPGRFEIHRLPLINQLIMTFGNSRRFPDCNCHSLLSLLSTFYLACLRPDVQITSLIEQTWKNRSSDILKDVPWTYVGTQSGVFRSYPGHRARKNFDPTK